MKSLYYITILSGLGCSGLVGCAEVPITKTNCWANAGPTLATSTKGEGPNARLVSRADTTPADVIPCR